MYFLAFFYVMEDAAVDFGMELLHHLGFILKEFKIVMPVLIPFSSIFYFSTAIIIPDVIH